MLHIYQTEHYDAMSARAANILAAQVFQNPRCVLGLATGSTPIGLYKQLIAKHQAGELSFAGVHTVNLDEYKGLAPTHDQSYRYFMQTNLFDHIDVKKEHTHVPDGLAADPAGECARYDALRSSLGDTDIQLLGLGHNGHIGFNEPGESFVKETHVVDLTQRTIEANARFFATMDDVPRQAITMGIGYIMAAKRILVVVSGEDKAEAVYNMLLGPITPKVPASILQLHPNVSVVGDRAALCRLTDGGVTLCG